MSDKTIRIVHCPYDDTGRFLNAFTALHRTGNGSARIALRLPVSIFAERRSLVERRLWATLYPLHATSDRHHVYSVTWSLRSVGAFPEFNGALAVDRGESEDSSVASLMGNYESLSRTGPDDALLFRRIAHACARELLRTIAEYVEHARAHDFAARAGYSKPLQYAMLSTNSGDASF